MAAKFIVRFISSGFQRFFQMEASSGILLILFALGAMIWANSSFGPAYFSLWEYKLAIGPEAHLLSKPLLLWINDGLMAIFFFIVGLEIKREFLAGELSTFRKAALPIFAAIGGMVLPALVFLGLQGGKPGSEGWGIPMATDIAFSLGILLLLGKRVPLSLKVFLTAFAIVDDIGAVLVIAIFYSHEIYWSAIGYASIFLALLVVLNLVGARNKYLYFLIGGVIWYYFLKSGIHPTIAGVLVAFTIPANKKMHFTSFLENVSKLMHRFTDEKSITEKEFLTHDQLEVIEQIEEESEHVLPPLQRLEHSLHAYVAFGIMPLFALANAGVALGSASGDEGSSLLWSIGISLIFGKFIGVLFFSWLSVKLGIADLPEDLNWLHISGAGLLGGVGFTMALFIANLALPEAALLSQAKLGILIASFVAGISGYVLLRYTLNRHKQ